MSRFRIARRAASAAVVALVMGAGVAQADPDPAPDGVNYDQIALATLDAVVAGDYVAVTDRLDGTVGKKLTPDALGKAWDVYQRQFGPYQSHGAPEDVARKDITVVNIPLRMERKPGQFRLSLHPDGTVAGLFFLKEGVPVP